jgi:ABC-2 type transport system permease protein
VTAVFEIARFESRQRVPATAAIAVGLALYAGLMVAIGPDIVASIDLDAYIDAIPPALRTAFGIDALGSFAGLLAAQLYQFGIVLLLGLYVAYAAAGTVAGDVERGRMDMLLSNPVSRTRIVAEKFLALVPAVVAVNVVLGAAVYAGAALVGEPLPASDVAAAHALAVPYLLAVAGIGTVASVVADRESVAQRAALAAVFGLFMVESLVAGTDVDALASLSPTAYYDPTAVLVRSQYDLVGAGVLLGAAAVLVVAGQFLFRRKDVE